MKATGLFTLLLAVAAPLARADETPARGVVVETMTPGLGAARAGIAPGDRLVGWERAASGAEPLARGPLTTPFDLDTVWTEQAPLGTVSFTLDRSGTSTSVPMSRSAWGLVARPAFDAESLAAYLEARDQVSRKEVSGARALETLADRAVARPAEACWLRLAAARGYAAAADPGRAEAILSDAGGAPGFGECRVRAEEARADLRQAKGDLEGAVAALQTVLGIRRSQDSNGLAVAAVLSRLGELLTRNTKYADAEAAHREALKLMREKAPESVQTAVFLRVLGNALAHRSEFQAARDLYVQSASLLERVSPGSFELASAFHNAAAVASLVGDLAGAEAYLQRAFETLRAAGASEERIALTQVTQAATLRLRGDAAASEALYQRILPILDADSQMAAFVSLAGLAYRRGDMETADDYYHKGQEIAAVREPGGNVHVTVLVGLGITALARGRADEAEKRYQEALAAAERADPKGRSVVFALSAQAELARHRKDWDRAEELHARALGLERAISPAGTKVALGLERLARVLEERGDRRRAEELLVEALVIERRMLPGSATEAEALHALGRLRAARGDLEGGLALMKEAAGSVEARRAPPLFSGGGLPLPPESAVYTDLIDLLTRMGRADEAFAVLERSRARALLQMLAERDLAPVDVPEDLERERRAADAERDRLEKQLSDASPSADPDGVEELLVQLRNALERQRRIAIRIRESSPLLADLRYSDTLDLQGARAALDPGTVLLSYSMGSERTLLFAVRGGGSSLGLSTFVIPAGRDRLQEDVLAFRGLLEKPEPALPALRRQGQALFELLLQPALPLIQGSQRILISPDGPLTMLPFSALSVSADGRSQYLAEWKPSHSVASATLYRKLRDRESRSPTSGRLIAFGDPLYPGIRGRGEAPAVVTRALRGRSLPSLPRTREEVLAIGDLYRDRSQSFLGADATEEKAKFELPKARYVHFACHGILNSRFPLSSALALTIPEAVPEAGDNGLLEAWEIIERVRTDADLVTLSACQTSLGAEVGGEGLVGLAWAFQYAGARSLLASLWSVSDESTVELMKAFYSELRAGHAKDDALQSAQRTLIRRGRHPFSWAAFELIGDRR
jgi:CHAT domain-containing protein